MRAILTFHSIDNSGAIVSYPVKLFALLLEKLLRANIPVISLDEMLSEVTKQGVVITFDDGMKSVYQNALPILKEYNMPAHIFIATGAIDTGEISADQPISVPKFEMLNWDEVAKLHENGINIEAHTHTHPDLRLLGEHQIINEFNVSNESIMSKTGVKPGYFAYPFGYHNEMVRQCAQSVYKASVTTELKSISEVSDTAALPRLDSYYFQSPKSIEYIDSYLMSLYLGIRNVMRNVKGSQCRADVI